MDNSRTGPVGLALTARCSQAERIMISGAILVAAMGVTVAMLEQAGLWQFAIIRIVTGLVTTGLNLAILLLAVPGQPRGEEEC